MNKTLLASTTVTLLALLSPATAHAQPASASQTETGITWFSVKRTPNNPTNLRVIWKQPAHLVDHYTVTLFDGSSDVSTTYPANTTTVDLTAPDACTRYTVKVSSTTLDGVTHTTSGWRVEPLAPGGIRGVVAGRTDNGTKASVRWEAPQNFRDLTYTVHVKQLNTSETVHEKVVSEPSLAVAGLNPERMYVAKIRAGNEYGSCTTSSVLLRNDRPGEPSAVTVTRDAGSPSTVVVNWVPPQWEGYGKPAGYTVAYRHAGSTKPEFVDVPYHKNEARLTLDVNKTWHFQVRTVGGNMSRSNWSKPFIVGKDNAVGKPETDSAVTIVDEKTGTIRVTFSRPVGSDTKYPTMKLAISPTVAGSARFHDTTTVSNRAGFAVFSQVPCGIYTVTVTGEGPVGGKEFARGVVNRCDSNAIPAGMWKLVHGKADITGNVVHMRYGNESRVVSSTQRRNTDAVFMTEATLHSGWGYGIWTRASLSQNAKVSGFSFQYDPGYANVNPSFGKALLLRVWDKGVECGTPVAKVKWPENLAVDGKHSIVVVNTKNSLYASIDGVKVFDVPDLTTAMKTSGCSANFAVPQGTEVGFRSWNPGTNAIFENTVLG